MWGEHEDMPQRQRRIASETKGGTDRQTRTVAEASTDDTIDTADDRPMPLRESAELGCSYECTLRIIRPNLIKKMDIVVHAVTH